MTLGDVLPALQQGAIDGAVAGMGPFTHMHFSDAAKYVTMTDQPAIFLIVEVSKKWYESLPKDLQEIIDKDAAAAVDRHQSGRDRMSARRPRPIGPPQAAS